MNLKTFAFHCLEFVIDQNSIAIDFAVLATGAVGKTSFIVHNRKYI